LNGDQVLQKLTKKHKTKKAAVYTIAVNDDVMNYLYA